MGCRLAGETEVSGGNLPQGHFCPSQNPTWPDPGLHPGRRGGKPATNRLSYGSAENSDLLPAQELFRNLHAQMHITITFFHYCLCNIRTS
jgi:hypothetical protein